jgi:Mg-chelatase subunit ChlD
MKNGREHLQAHSRPGAVKFLVVMTDGNANWHNGAYNESAARNQVLIEANLAKQLGYKIMAVSLGAEADVALMQQIADITDGEHFNVPGGQSVAAYRQQLMEVFRKIANARPLKLVQ